MKFTFMYEQFPPIYPDLQLTISLFYEINININAIIYIEYSRTCLTLNRQYLEIFLQSLEFPIQTTLKTVFNLNINYILISDKRVIIVFMYINYRKLGH